MCQCLTSVLNLIWYSSIPKTEASNLNDEGLECSAILEYQTQDMEISAIVENNPITFSSEMSQPTVQIQNDVSSSSCNASNIVSGHGLAIADLAIDQDYSYWECHIISKCFQDKNDASIDECKIGISTARNQKYYEILQGDGNASSLVLATKLMNSLGGLDIGDVVGVCVDLKSQTKTVQLYRNGEKIDEFDVKRYRGKVYPAIWLPLPDESYTVKLYNLEKDFKHYDTSIMNKKFLPLFNEKSRKGDGFV